MPGTTDFGAQVKSIGFYDLAESGIVNKRNVAVQETGIYYGGYLTLSTGNNISISPLVCIIGDGEYQLRVETTEAVVLELDNVNKYIVLRWAHSSTVDTDFMDILAVSAGNIAPNDLLVGMGVFPASSLTGYLYADATMTYVRSEPQVAGRMLKVIPTQASTTRTVQVNQGYVNYGTAALYVRPQTYTFDAVSANPRIDILYVDTTGTLQIYKGAEASSPVPDVLGYRNKIVLAEVKITAGMTTVPKENIRDVRLMTGAGVSVASIFPSSAGNAYKYLRLNSDASGHEYAYPTYAP